MARCGCAGAACSCFLTAGTNVTVTGAGTVGSPWVISAASVGFTPQSTTSIALSLVSNILTASAIIDPTTGNLLTITGSGLRVDCTDVATCVAGSVNIQGANSTTVQTAVTGAGTMVSPYIVTSSVIIDPVVGNRLVGSGTGLKVVEPLPRNGLNVGSTSPGATAIPGVTTTIDTATISITNPSATSPALVHLTYVASVTVSLDSTQGITISLGDGSALPFTFTNPGATTETFTFQVTFNDVQTIAAGATTAYPQNLDVIAAGAGGTYSATQWRVTYLLVTA